jgi:CO/xanthine dehydrogenase Mo-binding subunit
MDFLQPHVPYVVRGVGEPSTISSGPAVAATGRRLHPVPIRPEHILGS